MNVIFFFQNSISTYITFISLINLRLFVIIMCETVFSFTNVTRSSFSEIYENEERNVIQYPHRTREACCCKFTRWFIFLGHAREQVLAIALFR